MIRHEDHRLAVLARDLDPPQPGSRAERSLPMSSESDEMTSCVSLNANLQVPV